MKISFHGAARTVTGSKHLIKLKHGENILLDCGMFQGLGKETDELNHHFGFNPQKVSCLLLSHAHIDHSGLIPKLVKEGFKGKIYCTPATKDLTEILLFDSAEIQTYETEFTNKKRIADNLPPFEPLYTPDDVVHTMQLFETVPYDQWFEPSAGVQVLFTNTGHIVGAAAINLVINEGKKDIRITYSGDVGRYRSVLLQPPAEIPQADYIIMESTYGNTHHDLTFNNVDSMANWVKKVCVEQKGKLVIPAFSVGRTQEILYALNQLSLEKRLPELKVFVDSPLSLKATEVIKKYNDSFNERLQNVLAIDDDPFSFEGLKHVESVEDSKHLTTYMEPSVVISASGTADAGRVRHHIFSSIGEPNHCILFAGYCGQNSLGGQLLKGSKEIELFGDTCKVVAEVSKLQGMSAHGDYDDLSQFLSGQDAEKTKAVFLVHGEQDVQQAFAQKLDVKGFKKVVIPYQHQEVELEP